jgi:hypothetical protein
VSPLGISLRIDHRLSTLLHKQPYLIAKMRFLTLSAAVTVFSVGLAAPIQDPIPGVNLTDISGAAADVITDSYLIQYKQGTRKGDIDAHTATFPSQIGKAAEAVYNLRDLSIAPVKTNAAGIAKIGKAAIVSFLRFYMRF